MTTTITAPEESRMSTARDMVEMLRRHYLPEGRQPGGIFAPEIQAPDSGRRADLIWQGVTTASRNELVGHEIKVTRQDVLVELADPTKADAWQRYCNRWWLVVLDRSLVDGLDLPPTWGVMAPPSGRRTRAMTVVHPAPDLHPTDQAPAYATIGKWLHWRHHNLTAQHAMLTAEAERLRDANNRLRAQVPREGAAVSAHRAIVNEIVSQLGVEGHTTAHVGPWDALIPVADVVAALRDLGSVYRRAEHLEWQANRAVQAVADLAAAIDPKALADLQQAVAALRARSTAEEAA